MKRGAPDHPKFRLLASRLELRRFEVVGIMESLYHFTAAYAVRGDIGKWSNGEIAAAIDWAGDADRLVNALVDCGLLDCCPVNRLVVHDWQQHADQTVKRSDCIQKLGFASVQLADASGCELNASQPKPKPKPSHSQAADAAGGEGDRNGSLDPRRFVKPAVAEIQAYCLERKNTIDPQAFFDHYEAKGWRVGNTPMKNWMACVRTWEGRRREEAASKPDPSTPPRPLSEYDN